MELNEAINLIELLENLRIDPSLFTDRYASRIKRISDVVGRPMYQDKVLAYWKTKSFDGKKMELIVYKDKDKVTLKNAGAFANYKVFGKSMKARSIELTMKELLKPDSRKSYLRRRFKEK